MFSLRDDLAGGTYCHDHYEHFYVHDPKRRYISEATVRDRVIHQAIVQIIEPLIEKSFIFDSYSSRTGKGTHAAVDRLEQFLRKATKNYRHSTYVLKCDIRKFFDSIRHDILMSLLRKKIPDARFCHLVQMVVDSYASDSNGTIGLPLGNSTSQSFANLYLTSFDHFVKEQLHVPLYLRFCDDFLIVARTRSILEEILPQVRDFLFKERALELHSHILSTRLD